MGRQAFPIEKLRVTVTFRVTKDTRAKMTELKKHGVQLGVEVDAMIDRLYSELGLDK